MTLLAGLSLAKTPGRGLFSALLLALALVVAAPAQAETLADLILGLTQKNNLIKAAEDDVAASRERAKVTLGKWYPELNIDAAYGVERQQKPTTADTNFVSRDMDITITQLLWDFGKTNADIRQSALIVEQTQSTLHSVSQDVLLRGVTAYLNVTRSVQSLDFAKRSEANIKKQTELENALVESGKGFSTDVLQAKARLAGAQSRRIVSFGGLQIAKNEFRSVFEMEPVAPETWVRPPLPGASLPPSLEASLTIAMENNPGLKAEIIGTQIAAETINSTRSDEFYPTLQGVVERYFKKDFSGTAGFQVESEARVELSFPFNLGMTAANTLRASERDHSATVRRVADRRDLIEQQTRNAWINLETARLTTSALKNQAEIIMRFLQDAREERKAGRRSLLDVLDGETQLLNALSDAAAAEVDEAIATYSLMAVMGQLSPAIFADQ
ncbi:MAG TPA: hypothetical protein ENI69_10285 [Rhodospirillales bacterium]|nr:hypothetical protein [Rhodospirillales bacterium]